MGTDYFMLFLAFVVEAILFYYHTAHQEAFEQTVHLLLVGSILACAASVLVESFRPDLLELKRVRAYCTMLQGAWFYTVAFLLYNPFPGAAQPWKPAVEHAATMWVGVIFSWLCFVVALAHVVICAQVSGCTPPKRQSLYRRLNNDGAVEMGREPATPMEKVALDMAIDDSSEVELILAQ
uniref:Transmembrane protein 45B n=1 Tax=Plectus sambesii TaxID=2011161 RepID=A0A914V8X0_9BILA